MSKGDSGKRPRDPKDPVQKAHGTLDFPKRSPSVRPPPWMQAKETAVRNVDFRDPKTHAAAEPAMSAAAQAEAAAKAEAEAAVAAAAREAERKAGEERRMREELAQRSERLAQAISEAVALRARLLQDTEAQLIELAVGIASAIVEREIEIDPEIHGRLAQAALSCLGPAEKATLRASKHAYDAVVASFGGNNVRLEGVQVQVVCDNALHGFGYVIENSDTRIDARVQTRLKEVLDGLRDEQRRAAEHGEHGGSSEEAA